MTGGNQLRLSTILGGTPVATEVRRANAERTLFTSAGAVISEHMIAFAKGPLRLLEKLHWHLVWDLPIALWSISISVSVIGWVV